MFWRRFETSGESWSEDLREQVRDRLRLALDFATLGAYELTEEPAEQQEVAVPACRPVRAHVASLARSGCAHAADAQRRHCAAASTSEHRRRGGQVKVPEQPCVW